MLFDGDADLDVPDPAFLLGISEQSKLLVPWNRSVNAVPLERPMCSTPSRRELISHSCYRYSGQMCHNKQKWSHHERHEEGPLDIVSGRYIGRRYWMMMIAKKKASRNVS